MLQILEAMRGGSTGVMLIEEPMVDLDDSTCSHKFDVFEDLGGGSDLGFREEPGSLLGYLRARQERVARSHFQSMLGLPLHLELTLHNCLIYQLDCKLNCHRSKASDLRDQLSKWMDKWIEQARQLKDLKKMKLELSEALLKKMKALRRQWRTPRACAILDNW